MLQSEMDSVIPFAQIRKNFPTEHLLLIDTDEETLASGSIEIRGAKSAIPFASGAEMFAAFNALKKNNPRIVPCSPCYQEKMIIECIPSMRVT